METSVSIEILLLVAICMVNSNVTSIVLSARRIFVFERTRREKERLRKRKIGSARYRNEEIKWRLWASRSGGMRTAGNEETHFRRTLSRRAGNRRRNFRVIDLLSPQLVRHCSTIPLSLNLYLSVQSRFSLSAGN